MNDFLVIGANRQQAHATRRLEENLQRKGKQNSSHAPQHNIRLREIGKLIAYRFEEKVLPDECVNDDHGNGYFFLAAQVLNAKYSDPEKAKIKLIKWFEVYAPGLEKPDLVARNLLKKMHPRRLMASAKSAGNMLKVSLAERQLLSLKQFSPFDLTDAEFDHFKNEHKKKYNRDRMRRLRAQDNKLVPKRRKVGEPWLKLGISKSTYYRNKAQLKQQAEEVVDQERDNVVVVVADAVGQNVLPIRENITNIELAYTGSNKGNKKVPSDELSGGGSKPPVATELDHAISCEELLQQELFWLLEDREDER